MINNLITRKYTVDGRYYLELDNTCIYLVPLDVYNDNEVGKPFSKRLWK